MILKRLILVLLAMFLVMGCAGAVSGNTELNSTSCTIVITELDAPMTGNSPDTTAKTTAIGISPSAGVSWNLEGSSVFAGETVYTAIITVEADPNSFFNTTNLPVVKTEEITYSSISTTENENKLTITLTFAKTETEITPVSSITFSGITPPEANAQPVTTELTVSGTPTGSVSSPSGSITWTKNDGSPVGTTFDYDTIYKASFTVSAETNYRLKPDTTVVSDYETTNIEPNADGTKANITVTFQKTTQAPITIKNITSLSVSGLTPPVFGETPNTDFLVDGGGTPISVSWAPSV